MMSKITGQTLIEWGFKPAKWFKEAIEAADALARENHFAGGNHTEADMIAVVKRYEPPPIQYIGPQDPSKVPTHFNIEADEDFEIDNLAKVTHHIKEIAAVPVVRAVAVMPDACPQGGAGIPVGAVAVAENAIVPGWHSADICCSVAMTVFPSDTNPTAILDAGMKISHFGKGGRPYCHDIEISSDLLDNFERNPYLRGMRAKATKQFGTQGDGNHFFYVGRMESTDQIALVTHHGSRGPGAALYSRGIQTAQDLMGEAAPGIHKNNLWIPYDTQEGMDYWEALQLVRSWTKGNHYAIHNAVSKSLGLKDKDRYWNEHNFVFKREFGGKTFFAHAKGATPSYAGFSPDAYTGKTLIPLNMAQPILITQVNENSNHGMDFVSDASLGFAPHGAGRNFSRSDFGRLVTGRAKDMIADVTSKFDVRAFSGKHDISEFPEAYKNADKVVAQINKFGLTKVIDRVQPIGCIMAGHDGTDYRAIKKAKKAKREAESRAEVEE
jgi:tRNA-splicing ligase RtcB